MMALDRACIPAVVLIVEDEMVLRMRLVDRCGGSHARKAQLRDTADRDARQAAPGRRAPYSGIAEAKSGRL